MAVPSPVPRPRNSIVAASVASQRLHSRIIDDPHRAPECAFEIETYPALCEVSGLGDRPIETDQPGVTDGHQLIFPVFSQLFHAGNHGLGSQLWTGFKLLSRVPSCGENLYVSSANIDREDVHN